MRPGQAARADAVTFGALGGLQELEQIPAYHLLQPRPGAFHLHVRALPEPSDLGALMRLDAAEPVLDRAIKRPGDLRADLGDIADC